MNGRQNGPESPSQKSMLQGRNGLQGRSALPGMSVLKGKLRLQIGVFITGKAVSSVGDWVYIVALNILMLQRTHSAFAVAALWIVPFVASTVVGGWSGSIVDRISQRKLMMMMDIVRAVVIGAIPFFSTVWTVYALIFVAESAGIFFGQAALPYRTRLVPRAMQKRVNGFIGSINSGAMLAGPAIAGGLMWIGSSSFAIWADAASFLASALSMFLLPNLGPREAVAQHPAAAAPQLSTVAHAEPATDAPAPKAPEPQPSANARPSYLAHLREDWRESVGFLRGNWLFLVVVGCFSLVGVFCQAANSVEVVFAQDALHLGKVGYSTMVACTGVGVLIGSIAVTALSHRLSTRFLLAGGILLTTVSYLLYAFSIGLWTAAATLIPLGIFNAADGVGYQTYLQSALPAEKMGRVMGVISPPISILTVISIALTGWVSGFVHVRYSMIALTAASTIICLIGAFIMFQRRHRTAFDPLPPTHNMNLPNETGGFDSLV